MLTLLKGQNTVALGNDWFTGLTGFSDRNPDEVREQLEINGTRLSSRVNGQAYQHGRLEIVALQDLRDRVVAVDNLAGTLRVAELVGDAKALHADAANAGALFQVASQFNLLEMVSPHVTPEQGIAIYESDPTQGPACAIACGAGTIYRNYFVELDGQLGQTASKQVDCLANVGAALNQTLSRSSSNRLWEMQNGYALPSAEGLKAIDVKLQSLSEEERDKLRAKLMIGVQWDTQVTLRGCKHLVTQAYCSALPVAYSGLPSRRWERFARLVLEAAYEATLATAMLNASRNGMKTVYLTLLGGGAFGNDQAWILDTIRRACGLFHACDLDVKIVSFRKSNSAVRSMVEAIERDAPKTSAAGSRQARGELPDHYCPGCGAVQKAFPRYPWYFCNDCLTLAEDSQGRRLEFGNTSFSGGLYWKYADSADIGQAECGSVLCLIRGREVLVTEARFGGVVAQPVFSDMSLVCKSPEVVRLSR